MARLARVVAPGYPHHVTQRGNRKCDVFVSDSDCNRYLELLQRYSERHGLAIWAYCLMTNHVHLVVVPAAEESLARTFRDTHQAYATYFNQQIEATGHLWQGRFFSCILDEQHLWTAVRYVEMNPVRAGIVRKAEQYKWSSAPAHCRGKRDTLLANDFPPVGVVTDWSNWLAFDNQEQEEKLLRHTRTGRPFGPVAFVKALEKELRRALVPQKRGRKPRKKKSRERN